MGKHIKMTYNKATLHTLFDDLIHLKRSRVINFEAHHYEMLHPKYVLYETCNQEVEGEVGHSKPFSDTV